MSDLLAVHDLHVTFATRQGRKYPWSPLSVVHAVNGISFSLAKGRTLGVVGESGCGKSTLIRAIAGLAPIKSGDVSLQGQRVNYADKTAMQHLRASMQMIFQDPIASLNPRMTVRDIVTEPLKYFAPDKSSEDQTRIAGDMLDRVGIPSRNFNRFPHEFSGGQCQRIGIARALVARPAILLCDEPVSALDVSIQAQVIALLKELQAEMGLTMIFVAHDLGVVRHISDDVLVMYVGGMMEMASARDVIASPQHPYTRALLSSVPVPDPRMKITPEVLTGDLPSPLDLPQGCLFQSRCPIREPQCVHQRPQPKHANARTTACHLV